ncbi:MAG: hypothetical protein R6X33_06220 [Candidatus Brocadiia bacterium]
MKQTLQYLARGVSKYARRALLRSRQYRHWLAAERKTRKLSREQLRAEQWSKVKDVLEYAYRRVPLYTERFRGAGLTPDDVKKPEDLRRLPLLTKDDIRRNFPDRLVDTERQVRPERLGQTSGSTAASMHYLRPEEAWRRDLYYTIMLRAGGMWTVPLFVLATPHCTAATCSIREDREKDGVWISKAQKVPWLRPLDTMIGLPSSERILGAPDEYMENLRQIVTGHAPAIIVADPVYLAAFARYLRRSHAPVPELECIISTYELLTGSVRDLLDEVFGCEVYTVYWGSEILNVANECEHHTLHVNPDNVWLEVLHDGRPARPGEVGRAVLTDLGNYNMPFIRYDIGDAVERGDGTCACGKKTDTMVAVHGRTCDVIQTHNGDRTLTPLPAAGPIARGGLRSPPRTP